jgi:hypothetical protein
MSSTSAPAIRFISPVSGRAGRRTGVKTHDTAGAFVSIFRSLLSTAILGIPCGSQDTVASTSYANRPEFARRPGRRPAQVRPDRSNVVAPERLRDQLAVRQCLRGPRKSLLGGFVNRVNTARPIRRKQRDRAEIPRDVARCPSGSRAGRRRCQCRASVPRFVSLTSGCLRRRLCDWRSKHRVALRGQCSEI